MSAGPGGASIAWASESSYLGGVGGTPTWRQPGMNLSVGSASLENALIRARHPDDPKPQGSRAGNQEGAFSLTFDLTDDDFHPLIFPESSNTALASSGSSAPSAVWYLSADAVDGTEERFLEGAAVESVTWNYNQGEAVSVQFTIIYGDETDPDDAGSPSVPSAIDQPLKSEIQMFHDLNWQIDGVTVSDLQSLSLTISGMAMFRRGQQRAPTGVTVGAYTPTLTAEAILHDDTQRSLAYGSSTATTTADTIDETDTTLTFDDVSNLNVNGVQPNNYDWANLIATDGHMTEPVEYHVKDVGVA